MQQRDWTERDLLELCRNQEEESLNLEFKESAALSLDVGEQRERVTSELSKDVSAMANSDGGIIIYGIKEKQTPGKPRHGLADSIDAGVDPNVITKERLENVLTSNIRPTVDGLQIKAVPLNTHNPGRIAYVISIPQSLRAPHQARDKRFYKRFNFKAEPMEEYEVRSLYFRTLAPDLELVLKLAYKDETVPFEGRFEPQKTGDEYEWYDVKPEVTNHGHGAAEYSQYQYFVPTEAMEIDGLIRTAREVEVLWKSGASWHTLLFEHHLTSDELPIFPGENRSLHAFRIRFKDVSLKAPYMLLWRVRANNMRPRFGGLIITRIAGRWHLRPLNEEQVAEEIVIERIR